MAGPGSHLKILIRDWTGAEPTKSCGCEAWIQKMDKEGPAWSRKNSGEIVAKLLKEAQSHAIKWRAEPIKRRGFIKAARLRAIGVALWIPGSKIALEPFVLLMVVRAIELSERDAKQTAENAQ